jgi:hypothetical protein
MFHTVKMKWLLSSTIQCYFHTQSTLVDNYSELLNKGEEQNWEHALHTVLK